MTEQINYHSYMLEIYNILRENEGRLSSQEKNVLAYALVLNQRKEPILQILGQLYLRLRHFDRPLDDQIIKGGMKPVVWELYQKMGQDKNIVDSMNVLPGTIDFRPITWDDARFGNKMTEDEGFLGGGYVTFDPSEKYKSMEERIAIPEDDLIKSSRKAIFGEIVSSDQSISFGRAVVIIVILVIVIFGLFLVMINDSI